MIKWDGHSHTEYCPHGTVNDVEELIQKAISLKFQRYSVTEHAPLPPDFAQQCAGPDYPIRTAGMAAHDLEHYFNKILKLKDKYKSEIDIKLGVELDYLPDNLNYTRSFLNEYGTLLEDSNLSVHFMKGTGGLRAIDYSAKDFKEGLLHHYGDFRSIRKEYLRLVHESITADLGPYKPHRISHISLVNKFYKAFTSENSTFTLEEEQMYSLIFLEMEQRGYMLDFNMAGLFKKDCLEPYPPFELLKKFQPNILLVYGSDSHDLADIGRGYSSYEEMVKKTG